MPANCVERTYEAIFGCAESEAPSTDLEPQAAPWKRGHLMAANRVPRLT